MDEGGIKAAVLTRIRQRCRGRLLPVVASEFSLNGTGIRADLAVLSDSFYGVEIKSASDTLKRLPSQMEGYARYFDRTILVVASKHVRGLNSIDLHGAEVWRQEVLIDWQKHASGECRSISGHWLLQLLSVEEERRAYRSIGTEGLRDTALDLDLAKRREFEKAFHRRYAETSFLFWETVRGRAIRPKDLTMLSRFHNMRRQAQKAMAADELHWLTWANQLASSTP